VVEAMARVGPQCPPPGGGGGKRKNKVELGKITMLGIHDKNPFLKAV